MIISMEQLRNRHLAATDGEIGRVRDFLFEESTWTARWVVADTGDWLLGRKVILSPVSFQPPQELESNLPVNLSKQEIEGAPHLDEDAPVSREAEKTYFHHFHWPHYWVGGGLWGGLANPYSLNPQAETEEEPFSEPVKEMEETSELRSGHELTKYRLLNGEDTLGFVEDLLLDTEDWSVKYLQFDTRNWFHGKTLQLSPKKIKHISWPDHTISVDVTQQELDTAADHAIEAGSPGPMDSHVRALFGVTTTKISA